VDVGNGVGVPDGLSVRVGARVRVGEIFTVAVFVAETDGCGVTPTWLAVGVSGVFPRQLARLNKNKMIPMGMK